MKTYEEIANNVLLRRDEYVKAKKVRVKKTATAVCISLCFVISLIAIQAIWLNNNLIDGGDVNPQANPSATTSNADTTDESNKSQGDLLSGDLPQDIEIAVAGEDITDEKATSYLKENTLDIMNLLGVSSEISFCGGYCHITYNEDDATFVLRQGYRDYLVYSGKSLIGIVTLYMENGEMNYTLSCEARWFGNYDTYLKSHKDEKLLYLYIGMQEVIISPDGSCFNPMGYDVSGYLSKIQNPYNTLYSDKAVFTP